MNLERGTVFAGRYRLEQPIGAGGMGQVWRATQLALNRSVALKLMHANSDLFRSMFMTEAHVSAKLTHANIVPVVDFGEHEGVLFLVQQFVRGQDLGGLVAQATGGRLQLPLAVHITTQIVLGLQCAHENGIIHRDLKPGNVLVSNDGSVQLTDFGIAKVLSANGTAGHSTFLKGSPGYLAPELLRFEPPRFSADLFSVGCLFRELLTGRNPFLAPGMTTPEEVCHATLNLAVPPLVYEGIHVPPELEQLIQGLLVKDPAQRYQSAAHVLQVLAVIAAPMAVEATGQALRVYVARHQRAVADDPPWSPSRPGPMTPAPQPQLTPMPPGYPGPTITPGPGMHIPMTPAPPPSGPLGMSPMPTPMHGALPTQAHPPPRPWYQRAGVMIALVGLLVVAGAALIVQQVSSGSPRRPEIADAHLATPADAAIVAVSIDAPAPLDAAIAQVAIDAPPARAEVTLTLRVTPADATVSIDGKPVTGSSPFVVEHVRPDAELLVRVERRGYIAHEETVRVHDDTTLKLQLRAAKANPDPGRGCPPDDPLCGPR